MVIALRAVIYATLFVSVLLVFLPARILAVAGIERPAAIGAPQVVGAIVTSAGALVALWCIVTFAAVGKGTPAPFDPPRRLVMAGPYRYVRNPMYLSAAIAIAGVALYFQSVELLAYATTFFLASHLMVVFYEEPALRRTFGAEYDAYHGAVRRWWPRS